MSPIPSPRESAEIQPSIISPSQPEQIQPSNTTSSPFRPASRYQRDSGFIFATTWIASVLTVAASILFGIWAPLSFKVTRDGNRDSNAMQSSLLISVSAANAIQSSMLPSVSVVNAMQSSMLSFISDANAMQSSMLSSVSDANRMQSSMLSSVSDANRIAQHALSTASAQASLLEDTQTRLGALGQLALMQLCATLTATEPCSTFLARVDFSSLVSYLGPSAPPVLVGISKTSISNVLTALASYRPAFTESPTMTVAETPSVSSRSHVASTKSPTITNITETPSVSISSVPVNSLPPASNASSGLSSFSIAAILGIVFGGVGVGGLVLGVFVCRYRKKRAATEDGRERE